MTPAIIQWVRIRRSYLRCHLRHFRTRVFTPATTNASSETVRSHWSVRLPGNGNNIRQ